MSRRFLAAFVMSLLASPCCSGDVRGDEPAPTPNALESNVATPELPKPDAAVTHEVAPAEDIAPGETIVGESEILSEEGGTLILDPETACEDPNACFIDDFNIDYPLWYARGEALWLKRTGQGELTTATLRGADGSLGNYRVRTDGFENEPGVRGFVGRNIWDGLTYLEAGYFGLHDWNNRAELGNTNGIGIIETNLNLGFGLTAPTPTSQIVDYGSTMHNAELNIRSLFSPNFAFIGGLRYLNLAERLVISERGNFTILDENSVQQPSTYFASRTNSTENSILGPQIGLDVFKGVTDDIRVGAMSRLGLGFNFSESTVRQVRDGVSDSGDINLRNSRVQYDEETALCGVLELGVSSEIVLTRNIVIRGGYHFLWLHGVALALEQHANDILDQNGAQRQIENGADLIFFGPFVGLEISWGHVNY